MSGIQFSSEIDVGAFQATFSHQNSKVTIAGTSTNRPLECSYDELLRSAVRFLSTDVVKQRIPHAAFNLENTPFLLKFTVEKELKALGSNYSQIFGKPDHRGVDSIFHNAPRSNQATLVWGERGASLTVNRKTLEVSLTTSSPVSLELLVDVLITILRDPLTKEHAPEFYAPFMRRWGEDAFKATSLKPGIPSQLTRDVYLNSTPLVQTSSVVPQSNASEFWSGETSLPTPPTAPKRGRKSGETLALEKRTAALKEKEDTVAAQQASIMGRLKELHDQKQLLQQQEHQLREQTDKLAAREAELTTQRLELQRQQNEFEAHRQQIQTECAEQQKDSETRFATAQVLLEEAQRERHEAETIRAAINQELRAMIASTEVK